MVKTKSHCGTALAITAASLLFAGCATQSGGSATASVECSGVNSCKGQTQCKSESNDCKGMNSCKGKGWIKMSAAECKEKGGSSS